MFISRQQLCQLTINLALKSVIGAAVCTSLVFLTHVVATFPWILSMIIRFVNT